MTLQISKIVDLVNQKSKIQLVKELRGCKGLDLKEAKNLIEKNEVRHDHGGFDLDLDSVVDAFYGFESGPVFEEGVKVAIENYKSLGFETPVHAVQAVCEQYIK